MVPLCRLPEPLTPGTNRSPQVTAVARELSASSAARQSGQGSRVPLSEDIDAFASSGIGELARVYVLILIEVAVTAADGRRGVHHSTRLVSLEINESPA